MKTEILGGALIWHGACEDYQANLIDIAELIRRWHLIRHYETVELSLKDLNKIWRWNDIRQT